MNSYLFSNNMQISIGVDEFEEKKHLVVEAAEAFLKGLREKTIYKCMLIGVTDEGDIKSPSDGAFYVSKETRVDYLVMKVKKGIRHFTFKYRGIEFAN